MRFCRLSPQFHGDLKPGAEGGPFVEQIEKGFFGQKFVKAILCLPVQQGVLPFNARHHVAER